jgi:hypothetical protein
MVVLYAARHRLPVPGLARWLLALGILATLAANVAHGWSHGPVGAAVAAWPAASLVGSYELLLWLIRTAAAGVVVRRPSAHQASGPADHPVADLRLVPVPDLDAREERDSSSAKHGGLDDNNARRGAGANRACGPDWYGGLEAYQSADQEAAKGSPVNGDDAVGDNGEMDVDAAAVAAYRASVDAGAPLSERKLAATFGKSSRRWARHRMAEAMGRAVG